MERYQEIEHSLHKRFSKTIWNRFVGSIKQYELLSPGDRVAVCISGGQRFHAACQVHAAASAGQRFPV